MKDLTYNTERSSLLLAEYGRHIQDMVDYCVTIEDKEIRTVCANGIVRIMAKLREEKLANADIQQKLWNHLAIMSHFNLDIDYPVEIIRPEEVATKPAPMAIPARRIRQRHYGYLLEEGLRYLKSLPESEERDYLAGMMANRMKQSLFIWNPDSMSEEKVISDMARYTTNEVADSLQDFHFGPLQSVSVSIKKKKRK